MRSKTYSESDFADPAVARAAAGLRAFARKLWITGTPLGVNGILRRRLWVRPHKMWEYARAVACLSAERDLERDLRDPDPAPPYRVLDFGGAATLPIYFLAARECEVLCLDIDRALEEETNRVARKKGWRLRASTHDLTDSPLRESEGQFDAVISCSVLEHIPKRYQTVVLERLAAALRPGGVMALSFDYGLDAPVADAARDEAEVAVLVAATGMKWMDPAGFMDTAERFMLDKRHPRRRFTFASAFLRK